MLAMFFVVVLHVVGHGGIQRSVSWLTFGYEISWILTIISECAVNCFALISGYVGIQAKPKMSRIFVLWLQTAFYSVGITLLFQIFAPEKVSFETWKAALFPVTYKCYWYISAYMGMSLLAPFMNAALKNMAQSAARTLLLAMLVLFCVLPGVMGTDPFELSDGYCMAWLCVLYVVGGYMRLYRIPELLSRKKAFWGFWLSCGVTFAGKILLEMAINLIGEPTGKLLSVTFLTPTIVLNAIVLLCLFARTKPSAGAARLIRLLSPATLGVYLVHVHPLVWENLIYGATAPLAGYAAPIMCIGAAVCSVGIYVVCMAVDLVRIRLFAAAHISDFSRRLDMAAAGLAESNRRI